MNIISKYDTPFRLIKVYKPSGSDKTRVILFLDITGKMDVAANILMDFKKFSSFERIELIKPIKDGFIVDPYSFPLLFVCEWAVIFRKTTYKTFLMKMREKYGVSFEAILYVTGFEIGHNAYHSHKKLFGDNPNVLLNAGCELFKALGYGILEFVKFKHGKAINRVYNNFECELSRNSGKPSSHFIRGMIAGWDVASWNVHMNKIRVTEMKCIAKGDPYCEFHVVIS